MRNKKTNVSENERKEVKEMAKKTNKTNVNEKEIKTMNKKEKENKVMKAEEKVMKTESKALTVEKLLKVINNSKYTNPVTPAIIGHCDAIIEHYEYGVGVTHSDNTYVYSIRSNNPEKEDIQIDDVVWGYVRLYVKLISKTVSEYATIVVYQNNFDRLATTLITALDTGDYPASSLKALLDDAVASKTQLPINRVKNTEGRVVTYFAQYTHQPKYKIEYTLHSVQNMLLFEEYFNTALYYPTLTYNTPYRVVIDDVYIKHEGDVVTRFMLKLVSDNGSVYRIDTKIEPAIESTLLSLCASAKFEEAINNFEELREKLIGRKFLFSVLLEFSDNTGTQYEAFVFGKEVK